MAHGSCINLIYIYMLNIWEKMFLSIWDSDVGNALFNTAMQTQFLTEKWES